MIDWKCKYCTGIYAINASYEAEDSICDHCQRRQKPRVSLADDLREGRWDPRRGILLGTAFGRGIVTGVGVVIAIVAVRAWLGPRIGMGDMSKSFVELLVDTGILITVLSWLRFGVQKRKAGGIVLAAAGYAFRALARSEPWWGVTIIWKALKLLVRALR